MPTGSNWPRLSVEFYLAALSFVILDVESVFLFAWAVALRENGLGWTAFMAATIFILLLGAALVYLWRFRAVDWGPREVPTKPPGDQEPEEP